MADPVKREKMARQGREIGKRNFYQNGDADMRAKARAAISQGLTAWCPPEFLDLNRELRRQCIRLADRKRMILEQVPGTTEHARLSMANMRLAQRIRAERERAQAY